MSDSSICPIHRILSGAITTSQSGPESNGKEGVLHIPQSLTKASPSDCLMSYPGHSLRESYSSEEMQLMYSTAPANWAVQVRVDLRVIAMKWYSTFSKAPGVKPPYQLV